MRDGGAPTETIGRGSSVHCITKKEPLRGREGGGVIGSKRKGDWERDREAWREIEMRRGRERWKDR